MLKGKKPNTLNLRKFINKYQHNIYMLKEEFPNTLIFEIILIITLLLYMLKEEFPNTLKKNTQLCHIDIYWYEICREYNV